MEARLWVPANAYEAEVVCRVNWAGFWFVVLQQ